MITYKSGDISTLLESSYFDLNAKYSKESQMTED